MKIVDPPKIWTAPTCPECDEVLKSHAGRGYKFFHAFAFEPYNGDSSGKCILDGAPFEIDGTPIPNRPYVADWLTTPHSRLVKRDMKVTPLTIELNEEDIGKAVSYYLTRMGYAAKEDEDKQVVKSEDFQVSVFWDNPKVRVIAVKRT